VKGTKDGWFRTSPIGLGFTRARPANATAVYASCPTALIFGVWDSTGPLGGQGAKFQRALVSEIVGVGATAGVKTASRLDPVAIQRAIKIYQSKTDEATWEVDESRAKAEKGKPVEFGRKGTKEKGLPSGINHGNVAPTIDDIAGGVTVDYAIQTTVLSLGALRKLRFQEDVSGRPLDDGARKKAEPAVRSALAALALAGITALREQGFDLRSRSLLVPEGPLILELVPGDGGEPERRSLSFLEAASLLKKAGDAAAAADFPWKREPIVLEPSEKLAELIRRSRALAGRTSSDAEEAEG
jgi:CRISPR-associated protein Csb1